MVTRYLGDGAPFDDRDGMIWIDGEMRPWKGAVIHVLTHALHYASSVFEGEKAYGGRVFELDRHSERLRRSAELLDFEVPFSTRALSEATREVVRQYDEPELYVRPVAWRGSEMMGVSGQRNRIHVAIAAWPTPVAGSVDRRMGGVGLARAHWIRTAPTMAPLQSKAAGLYMAGTLAKHEAEARGFEDALTMDYRGYIAEATTANIFLVVDGALHTPRTECVLNGITRQTIMRLARDMDLAVIERDIPPGDLALASEVFLTGTAAEVMPVKQIEDIAFKPGSVTEQLMTAYDRLIGRA